MARKSFGTLANFAHASEQARARTTNGAATRGSKKRGKLGGRIGWQTGKEIWFFRQLTNHALTTCPSSGMALQWEKLNAIGQVRGRTQFGDEFEIINTPADRAA